MFQSWGWKISCFEIWQHHKIRHWGAMDRSASRPETQNELNTKIPTKPSANKDNEAPQTMRTTQDSRHLFTKWEKNFDMLKKKLPARPIAWHTGGWLFYQPIRPTIPFWSIQWNWGELPREVESRLSSLTSSTVLNDGHVSLHPMAGENNTETSWMLLHTLMNAALL